MKKHQKNICILLIAFILLLGICCDHVQTDSFLSYQAFDISLKLSDETIPTIEANNHVSFINQYCFNEVLGQQASAILQQHASRRSFSTRGGKSSSFAYLLTYLLPLLLSSFLISEAYDFMPDIRESSFVIRYIQHKDGKKSQLSF